MLVHAAEQSFQEGVNNLRQRRHKEALAFFRGAIEIEKRMGSRKPQARYLSYFGLCLGLTRGGIHEAVKLCRKAATMEGYRPEISYNLGRVLLMAGKRRQAHKALLEGLRMMPNDPGIRRELKRMGVRRRPVLPFLSRTSSINVLLGRLRASS